MDVKESMKYDFKTIEKKWQDIWDKEKTFAAKQDFSLPKYYALVEFPYPSGQGLHVGHPRSYTALDIVARKKRLQGSPVSSIFSSACRATCVLRPLPSTSPASS